MKRTAVGKQDSEPLLPWSVPSAQQQHVLPKLKNPGRVVLLCLAFLGTFACFSGLLLLRQYKRITTIGIWGTLGKIPVIDQTQSRTSSDICPQVNILLPERNKRVWDAFNVQLDTDSFKNKTIGWLHGAVEKETVSYDDMGPVGEDDRWKVLATFHEYLNETYPLVHSKLTLTLVNTYRLVYEWTGSDPSLKPLLLAAHQDVVPVDEDTLNEWVQPPFSGLYDGERIWGRGSSDDKGSLISIMSTVETLLSTKFQPTRTIVLAFGFDEEISGYYGALEIGKYLEAKYGKDAFAMIVDEGGGYTELPGVAFAVPGVGEKGYFDVRVEVLTPGGHSSLPPAHTGIGILSSLLVKYEDNPFKATIHRNTPEHETLLCIAEHMPSVDNWFIEMLRKSVLTSIDSDVVLGLLEWVIQQDTTLNNFFGTTQSINVIQGGVKSNALPEQTWAIMNHRISAQSNLAEVRERDANVVSDLAKKFDLNYTAFGKTLRIGSSGSLDISSAYGRDLEPAPVTPTNEAPFKLLSGTIRAAYGSRRNAVDGDDIKVAPITFPANTDTRHYWNLTNHIFRYNHAHRAEGIHTVNEAIHADDFLEIIRFFATLILNADEYEL